MTSVLATKEAALTLIKGALYLVATPIGNKEDITLRALNVLKSVDCILAEDTRHSKKLLNIYGIKTPMKALHAHNEHEYSETCIKSLLEGNSLALISDAGTPLISDPGFLLVKQAHECNIPVIPIPGACALTAALSAAGVPCDTFLFLGFLPAKSKARQTKLTALLAEEHTLVFYESTHRILDCVQDILSLFGAQCPLVLVKELTKSHERFINKTAQEIQDWLLAAPEHTKGEFVLIIPPRKKIQANDQKTELLSLLLKELPLKQAVSIAAAYTQANKNELYELALQLSGK